jgi:hypothetical protein
VSFDYDEAALDELVQTLVGLSDRSDNLAPALREVADDFRELSRRRFGRGNGWAAVSSDYAARKARAGKGRTVGRYSGELEASLTRRGARWHHEKIEPDRVTVSSRAPHAHLFDAGRNRQRARDLVVLKDADRRRWRTILARYLFEGVT